MFCEISQRLHFLPSTESYMAHLSCAEVNILCCLFGCPVSANNNVISDQLQIIWQEALLA
jgi:hypothetical protein